MQPVLQAVVSGMFTIVYLYISEALPVALFELWVLLLGDVFFSRIRAMSTRDYGILGVSMDVQWCSAKSPRWPNIVLGWGRDSSSGCGFLHERGSLWLCGRCLADGSPLLSLLVVDLAVPSAEAPAVFSVGQHVMGSASPFITRSLALPWDILRCTASL